MSPSSSICSTRRRRPQQQLKQRDRRSLQQQLQPLFSSLAALLLVPLLLLSPTTSTTFLMAHAFIIVDPSLSLSSPVSSSLLLSTASRPTTQTTSIDFDLELGNQAEVAEKERPLENEQNDASMSYGMDYEFDDDLYEDYDYDEDSEVEQQPPPSEEVDTIGYGSSSSTSISTSSSMSSYHTLTPTLELLVDWTLEYADAIDLAGGMTRVSVGVQHMLDSDYVFCSPTIGPINKVDFINLMTSYRLQGLDLASAIPDLQVHYDGWHVDPHNPWRIWTVARYSGTHTGSVVVPQTGLQLIPPPSTGDKDDDDDNDYTSKSFVSGPELQSFVWTPHKTLIWQTVGYVGDTYTGTNVGHGCGNLDGLLVSMGLPPLLIETTQPLRNLQGFLSQFLPSSGSITTTTRTTKVQSSYSGLPYWWHQRTSSQQNNIHR